MGMNYLLKQFRLMCIIVVVSVITYGQPAVFATHSLHEIITVRNKRRTTAVSRCTSTPTTVKRR